MKKSLYIVLLSLAAFSIGIVYVTARLATKSHVGTGGFIRNLTNESPMPVDTLNLGFNSFYIAGITDHYLFLGNIVAPRRMIMVEMSSLDTMHVDLEISNPNRMRFNSVRLLVDSPSFVLADGSVPVIFVGNLLDRIARPLLRDRVFFMDLLRIDSTSFVITTLDRSKKRILAQLNVSPFGLAVSPQLLEEQVDGLFCTHGMMHFDKMRKRLVYLYSYRNEYLLTDSDLNLLSCGNTIDTMYNAHIEVANIQSKSSTTFSSPPVIVNRQSALDGDLLYVNSTLLADNEIDDQFRRVSVIDVYDVNTNQYVKSIYLPDLGRDKLTYFGVKGDKLFAIYRDQLISYKLPGTGFVKEDRL